MEAGELIAEPQGSTEARRNDDETETHEDAEFNDLPVHFQPVEDGGNDTAGPAAPPVSESVVSHQAFVNVVHHGFCWRQTLQFYEILHQGTFVL